jgi:hypothetical protein
MCFFPSVSSCLDDGLKSDFVAELGDLADQPLDLDVGRPLVEILGAEILVRGAVLQTAAKLYVLIYTRRHHSAVSSSGVGRRPVLNSQ